MQKKLFLFGFRESPNRKFPFNIENELNETIFHEAWDNQLK